MTLRGMANAAVEASCLAWRWRRPVLAGAAIDSPSEQRRPAAVFSTASRARDTTSDALCRAQLSPRQGAVSAGSQPRFCRRLVKVDSFFGAERLPSTNAPLREPATVLTALPPRGGFRSPFAADAPRGLPRGAQWLDPMRLRVGQAPFVDFCNQNDPRARAANPPIPRRDHAVPRALTLSVASRLVYPRSEDPEQLAAIPVEVSRARGRRWLTPPRLPSSRLLETRASPQPDWLGHLVSWIRDESGWIGRSHQVRDRVARRLRVHPPGSLSLSPTRPRTTPARASIAPGSRAASRAPPRREARSAAPEVPSVNGPPRSGCGVVHRL